MRALILVVTAAAALAAGWYVVEWMPRDMSAAAALAPPAAAHPQEIRSVRLVGVRLPVTILQSQLRTRVGDTLDGALLALDRQSLRDALIERGHWAAEVGGPDLTFGDDGGAHVAFPIEPGPVFRIRDVTVAGQAKGVVPAGAQGALTLTAGDPVSPERLARNAELLAAYLQRNGVRGTSVAVETTTDRGELAVDVRFVVRRASRR